MSLKMIAEFFTNALLKRHAPVLLKLLKPVFLKRHCHFGW